jgi:hypothetical protein
MNCAVIRLLKAGGLSICADVTGRYHAGMDTYAPVAGHFNIRPRCKNLFITPDTAGSAKTDDDKNVCIYKSSQTMHVTSEDIFFVLIETHIAWTPY